MNGQFTGGWQRLRRRGRSALRGHHVARAAFEAMRFVARLLNRYHPRAPLSRLVRDAQIVRGGERSVWMGDHPEIPHEVAYLEVSFDGVSHRVPGHNPSGPGAGSRVRAMMAMSGDQPFTGTAAW
jgi:hypothetical protein